jgi:hypothetical protein
LCCHEVSPFAIVKENQRPSVEGAEILIPQCGDLTTPDAVFAVAKTAPFVGAWGAAGIANTLIAGALPPPHRVIAGKTRPASQ